VGFFSVMMNMLTDMYDVPQKDAMASRSD